MKSLITTGLILLFSTQLLSQTTDEIPTPERVLVVYRSNHTYSDDIANYYAQKRNIPESNVFGIDITDPGYYGCEFRWNDEEIVDLSLPGNGGWYYVKNVIADQIEQYLNTNYYEGQPLKNVIRYIVLCKGIPLKVKYDDILGWDQNSLFRNRVSVDALLCLINQPNGLSFVNLYETYYSLYRNEYFDVDPRYSMDYHFISNYFVNDQNWYMQYLVSRLDGDDFNDVIDLIDRSVDPDMNGEKYWILDDDPAAAVSGGMEETHYILNSFGFNLNPAIYINSPEWIVNNHPTGEQVMGYVSHGRNTAINDPNRPRMPATYILDTLDFDYANGAIFNSWESFNGWSFGATRNDHGLVSDFIHTGGTGGGGHVYEPFEPGAFHERIVFPSYAMGYSTVEAMYQGFPYMAWQNIIVGDPLTRIYDCPNTVITTNTMIGNGDYNCDVIVLPDVTLTISSGSTVNFNRNAELKIFGTLELEEGAILNFNSYGTFILHGNVNGSNAYLNFYQRSILNLENSSDFVNCNLTFNDVSKFKMKEDTFLNTTSNFQLTFNNNSMFESEGSVIVNNNGVTLNDNTLFYTTGVLNVNDNGTINFNDVSRLESSNLMNIYAGATLNFNDNSWMKVMGNFICEGEVLNNVFFNFGDSPVNRIDFLINSGTLLIDYATINKGKIAIGKNPNQPGPEYMSITNTTFRDNETAIKISLGGSPTISPAIITNCSFSNISEVGIDIQQVTEIEIEHCTIDLNSSQNSKGVRIRNNGSVIISDVLISDGGTGITSFLGEEDDPELIEDLLTFIDINQCVIETDIGISLNGQDFPFNSVNVYGNHFSNEKNGVIINDFSNYNVTLSENIIFGGSNEYSKAGITLSNGDEVFVINNSITDFLTGINLSNVTTPFIKENSISAIDLTFEPQSGIVAVSSHGQIRKNTIRYHKNGIELGSSSPKIGANIITDNDNYGIYISDNSYPDLSESFVGEEQYPLSGYNTIRENGLCEQIQNSELYLLESLVTLDKGCNTIADDREEDPGQCNYLYLIDGTKVPELIIKARGNYWGNHPVYGNDPTGRFGEEVTIDYSNFLSEPCIFSQGTTELLLANSKGEVYDTVYSTGIIASGLTDVETRYATANNYYYNNQFSQAIQEYQGIIQNYGNSKESMQAYNRLYTIANLTNSTPAEFNQLRDFSLQQAANQTDSLMIGALNHLGDLCLVSAAEYLPAINNFDQIAQQNPNTDIALYRQIDALTTSLLVPQDSSLNKGILGKYSVDNLSDYTSKLSELLKTRGKSGLESEEELLPKEYTLYQNYPNPFNPVTTIKYDLPNTSDVSLIIYDILGRKVKELVNTKQQAGRYEVQFNASSLASGVYIYQLIAEKYISSKKMILLK